MIRKRIKKRIEQRRNYRAEKAQNKEENQSPNTAESHDTATCKQNVNTDNNDTEVPSQVVAEPMAKTFDYLTDICKEKRFNKNEFNIILKVIKMELQPLIYLVLFIKGILLWSNTGFTAIVFALCLSMAYVDVVQYLFGFTFIITSLLMVAMKMNPTNTIFTLSLFVAAVTPMEPDTDTKPSEEAVQGWRFESFRVFKRARRVRQRLQKGFATLGEFQYGLYILSIYIGKARTIYFYKEQSFSKALCILNVIIGTMCMVLPHHALFAVISTVIFSVKPILFIQQQRGKQKGEFAKKMKSAFENIEPDIPKIS
eukprot:212602_1